MLAVGLTGAASLSAQIPSGSYVVSSFQISATSPTGGLAIVHPRTPGPATIVTGLPAELTGTNSPVVGANCVAYRPDDGFLLVGEIAGTNDTIELHEIFITGGAVLIDQKTVVGTGSSSAASITQIAMLPNGDAVFGTSNLVNSAPLFGSKFGYFDRTTNTVTPIPIAAPGGIVNAMAVDPALNRIYFATGVNVQYAPLTGGAPTPIASIPSSVGLAVDQDGNLLTAWNTSVDRIDVQTGALTTIATVGLNPNGLFIEKATGAPVVALNGLSTPGILWVNGSTPQTLATNVLGVCSGVAVVDSAQEYGPATPGTSSYAFRTFPAPAGLPIAGNTTHAVAVDTTSGPGNIGLLAASFGPANLPVFGITVLVDPTGAVVVGPFAPGTSVPLPIPAGLPPASVFLQGIHLDAGNPNGFAATAGLRIETIL